MDQYECTNCNSIYISDRNGGYTFLKGRKRDWEEFLLNNLVFPFDGVVDEFQERGSIQHGDKIVVIKIIGEDDLYSIIAEIKIGRKKYQFPICDIAVVDKKSRDFKILDDYRSIAAFSEMFVNSYSIAALSKSISVFVNFILSLSKNTLKSSLSY